MITRGKCLLAVCVSMLAVAAPATAAPDPAYVALGDSYAAGPLIPLQIQPYGCLKSDHNYAHLAAPKLGLDLRDAELQRRRDRGHDAAAGRVARGPNPPQFDALDADTALVTFRSAATTSASRASREDCLERDRNDRHAVQGQLRARRARRDLASASPATAPKVAAVLQGIHARAPQARVLVVNYAAILPDAAAAAGRRCRSPTATSP